MKNTLTFFLCFSFLSAFAQKENSTKTLKLYYNFEYSDWSREYPESFQQILRRSGSDFEMGYLSPAIAFSKGRFLHEIELSKFRFTSNDEITTNEYIGQDINEVIGGARENTFDIALRFESGIALFKESGFFNPIFALGIQPYFTYGEIYPKTSLRSNIFFRNGGAILHFLPHLNFRITERLMIDLTPAFALSDFKSSFERFENPGLTYEESVVRKNDFVAFPKRFGIRLGVGYKI